MANEITIQAALSLARDVVVLQSTATKQNNQTGAKSIQQQVSVPWANAATNATKLFDPAVMQLASLGYVFVKNMAQVGGGTGGLDQYVDLSLIQQIDLSPYGESFAILKPQEFILLAVNKATAPTLYARTRSPSDTDVGPALVLLCAAEI